MRSYPQNRNGSSTVPVLLSYQPILYGQPPHADKLPRVVRHQRIAQRPCVRGDQHVPVPYALSRPFQGRKYIAKMHGCCAVKVEYLYPRQDLHQRKTVALGICALLYAIFKLSEGDRRDAQIREDVALDNLVNAVLRMADGIDQYVGIQHIHRQSSSRTVECCSGRPSAKKSEVKLSSPC